MTRIILSVGLTLVWAGALWASDRPASSAERPSGTGVIVHSDGYVLTAYHVVANARRVVVVTPGEFRASAIVVSTDAEHDLALLKAETVGLSEASLGHAGAVQLDQEVLAVGFPFGLREVSLTRGRIAAVRTKGVQRVFQVDAAVNPGNSGGPLFNAYGELIGILTTKFSHPSGIVPEGMAFAVPVSYATPLLANIEGFDFTMIGKKRNAKMGKRGMDPQNLAPMVVRTTVRIEIAKAAEGIPAVPAPVDSAKQPDAVRSPIVQAEPRSPGSAQADQAMIRQVNEQLRALQEEELQRLAQRGIAPPEGMVLVPGGEFLMGAEDGLPDARPLHRVYVSTYWLDRHEVTNRHYRQCVESGGCAPPKDQSAHGDPVLSDHPVTNVTWMQARHYCGWRGKRLPTEAEWEKAARGIDGRLYPWGNSDEVFKARPRPVERSAGRNGTVPVGSLDFARSPYGVADLVMSVSEWVNDWYAEDFYRSSPSRDPQGPARGSFRVLRGGETTERPLELRASYRGWDEMTYWGPSLGFRCAQDGS